MCNASATGQNAPGAAGYAPAVRWLFGILAVTVVGAATYLAWSVSRDDPAPTPAGAPAERATPPAPAEPPSPSPAAAASRASRRGRPRAPRAAARGARPREVAAPAPSEAAPPADEPADVPDTPEQRAQRLYTARGRLAKGNYPGAVEAALELAERHPDWAEDAYQVAIQALCALDEPDRARELLGRVKQAIVIETVTAGCAEHGVKLVP